MPTFLPISLSFLLIWPLIFGSVVRPCPHKKPCYRQPSGMLDFRSKPQSSQVQFCSSVLRMETFLSSIVTINGQFLTSNTPLLGSVPPVPPHLIHNAMPSCDSLFLMFMVIPPSAILSSTFYSQTYIFWTVSGTDFFSLKCPGFQRKVLFFFLRVVKKLSTASFQKEYILIAFYMVFNTLLGK